MAAASKLVEDLSNIPQIVGALGLSIAEAQKAFNLDYMENVERLIGIALSIKKQAGDDPSFAEFQEFISGLLTQLAPPRYQFTETTLAVRLDLAQTLDVGASAGFGVGYGAMAVNAAVTVGFGYDYRAAAEVRTTLQAISADANAFATLIARAEKLSDKALTLPPAATVDTHIVDKSHALVEKMTDLTLKRPSPASPPAPPPSE